jgi:hypothetical protein
MSAKRHKAAEPEPKHGHGIFNRKERKEREALISALFAFFAVKLPFAFRRSALLFGRCLRAAGLPRIMEDPVDR